MGYKERDEQGWRKMLEIADELKGLATVTRDEAHLRVGVHTWSRVLRRMAQELPREQDMDDIIERITNLISDLESERKITTDPDKGRALSIAITHLEDARFRLAA